MRKILVLCILFALFAGAYVIIVNGVETERFVIKSYSQIQDADSMLGIAIGDVERKNTTLFESKKKELDDALTNYQNAKNEYQELLPAMQLAMQESSFSGVDLYDIDFLWTIIGNYATEEGVVLQFDVRKSSVVIEEGQTPDNEEYIFCDLEFAVVGQYIPITDFIYDLEDDDRLNFEIRNFKLVANTSSADKDGKYNVDDLLATFTVKSVPLNKRNLSAVSSAEQTTTSSSTGNTSTNTTTSSTTSTSTTTNTVITN